MVTKKIEDFIVDKWKFAKLTKPKKQLIFKSVKIKNHGLQQAKPCFALGQNQP